jgi:hypothetical protein
VLVIPAANARQATADHAFIATGHWGSEVISAYQNAEVGT